MSKSILIFLLSLTSLFCSISSYAFFEPASKQQVQAITTVNLNTADVHTLAKLKGVGMKRAEAIVAYRETNGKFTSVDDLLKIKGIGAKIIESNKDIIAL